MQQIIKVKISSVSLNTGQIDGVPKNARSIKDERYQSLKQSIINDPEFMELKPLYVYDNVVIAGNMRLRACRELKWKEIPIIRIPKSFPPEKLRALAIKDNTHYGEHDWDALANEWSDNPLKEWGISKDYVAFNPNLTPETSQAQVTDQDINNMQNKLNDQYSGTQNNTIFEIICPKCGHEFKVNSPR